MTGGDDDLTAIIGVGAARARRLRDGLGIETLADLAGLSVDQLEERLRSAGISGVSRAAAESWITQANELVSRAGAEGDAEAGDPRPARSARPENGNGLWRAEASFVVELQSRSGEDRLRTAVHHMEGDTGEEWPGFDCERLCAWLRARGPAALPSDAVAIAIAPAPAAPAMEGPGDASAAASRAEVAADLALGVTLEAAVLDDDPARAIARIPVGGAWAVDARWTLSEPLPDAAAGEWIVRASFEPIGQGEPLEVVDAPRRLPAHYEPEARDTPPGAWYVDLRPIQFHDPGV